jgi:hypothetical protein
MNSRGGRDARNEQRKRSVKGPGGGGQGEDGWQAAPMRAAKISGEKIDTAKLKNIFIKQENIEDIQLGPSSNKGGGFKWSHGSAGSKSSSRHEESTIMQNRFSALCESSSGPPSSYYGRTSGGFSRSSSRLTSMVGPPSSSSSYMGRGSRGQSSENDRAKAIQVPSINEPIWLCGVTRIHLCLQISLRIRNHKQKLFKSVTKVGLINEKNRGSKIS